MRHWKAWLFLALALWGGWSWWGSRPVARAAGVIAPGDPVQVDFDAPQPPIALEAATLHPLARFFLTTRVLSREDHRCVPRAIQMEQHRNVPHLIVRNLDISLIAEVRAVP